MIYYVHTVTFNSRTSLELTDAVVERDDGGRVVLGRLCGAEPGGVGSRETYEEYSTSDGKGTSPEAG